MTRASLREWRRPSGLGLRRFPMESSFRFRRSFAGGSIACRQASALAGEMDIPTATVKEADLQLKVLTTGALRTETSRVIAAPAIGGGTLQIIKLARFGVQVHKGEVVLDFDPSEQEYNLAQNRSDF